KVMALVAEKTGYPQEMLDPNLDMEADLGIDTVKQAEIFGMLRESYGIGRDDKLTLKDIPTLAKVADYLVSRMGAPVTAEAAVAPTPPVPFNAPPAMVAPNPAATAPTPLPGKGPGAAHDVLAKVTAMIASKTGYPPEMLDPNLDMEADLGIDTVKQAEIFGEVREAFGIPRIEGVNLKDYPTISHVAGFVSTHAGRAVPAQAAASAPPLDTAMVAPYKGGGLVRRVPRVSPAPAEGSAARSAFVVGHGALAEALRHKYPHAAGDIALFSGPAKELFLFARSRAADLDAGKLGILALTEMGGHQGIDKAAHPEQGGVTGLAKSLAAEFPKAWVRALDLDPSEDVAARVRHVEAELKVDKSLVEVGRSARGRVVVRTIEAGTTDGQHPTLPTGAVLVVTGGARGPRAAEAQARAPGPHPRAHRRRPLLRRGSRQGPGHGGPQGQGRPRDARRHREDGGSPARPRRDRAESARPAQRGRHRRVRAGRRGRRRRAGARALRRAPAARQGPRRAARRRPGGVQAPRRQGRGRLRPRVEAQGRGRVHPRAPHGKGPPRVLRHVRQRRGPL